MAGDIVWFAGPQEIGIGDIFSSEELENPALAPLDIEEPTVSMFFLANTGPFSGRDGNASYSATAARAPESRVPSECGVAHRGFGALEWH